MAERDPAPAGAASSFVNAAEIVKRVIQPQYPEAANTTPQKTTTVYVGVGGFAMPMTVPVLTGEALKQQQREQHRIIMKHADRMNAEYRARQTRKNGLTHG